MSERSTSPLPDLERASETDQGDDAFTSSLIRSLSSVQLSDELPSAVVTNGNDHTDFNTPYPPVPPVSRFLSPGDSEPRSPTPERAESPMPVDLEAIVAEARAEILARYGPQPSDVVVRGPGAIVTDGVTYNVTNGSNGGPASGIPLPVINTRRPIADAPGPVSYSAFNQMMTEASLQQTMAAIQAVNSNGSNGDTGARDGESFCDCPLNTPTRGGGPYCVRCGCVRLCLCVDSTTMGMNDGQRDGMHVCGRCGMAKFLEFNDSE